MVPLNKLIVLLEIMFVLYLKVPLLTSNSGRMHSFIIFASPMHLLLLSKIPLESFKLPARRKTSPISELLDAESGYVLLVNAKPSLNPIHKRVYFLDLFRIRLVTYVGIIAKLATLVKLTMSALMKV